MENNLEKLNDHLFKVMDNLNREELKGEQLKEEMNRAKAITGVAKTIVDNAKVVLEATIFKHDGIPLNVDIPKVFGVNNLKKIG